MPNSLKDAIALGGENQIRFTGGGTGVPPTDWTIDFEDTFASFGSPWSVGFGWGNTANNDAADVYEGNVQIYDGQLLLGINHTGNGNVTQGAVNTKGSYTFSPPIYLEAKINPAGREGILPAWWAKPNSEAWPPELDFFEIFHTGEPGDEQTANFNTHYSTSGNCGDSSTHNQGGPYAHDAGEVITNGYHTYGCLWERDRIEFYFDGEKVAEETRSDILNALNACTPFYMMFSNHVNRIGSADFSSSWWEETRAEYVRTYTP